MDIIYRTIVDFPKYEVSNTGEVRGPRGIISQHHRKDRYTSVKLYRSGKDGRYERKNRLVHRLVAIAFISNPDNRSIVNHKDGNRANNNVANLEWCTHRQNTVHAHTNDMINKWERKVAQYTVDGKFIAEYSSLSKASRKTGVPLYNISKVCRKNHRTAGGYRWKYSDNKEQEPTPDIKNKEIWRQIEEFDSYMISKEGQVFSLRRNKIMSLHKAGYTRAKLFKDGKAYTKKVHILVAKAFLPSVSGKPLVNHKNGDRHDNCVENLEWCTHRENAQHAVDTGLCPRTKGKWVIKCALDGEELEMYTSIQDASEFTGTNREGISHVCHGRRKTAGGWKWKWA